MSTEQAKPQQQLWAENTGGEDFEPVASGTYAAVCTKIVHVGHIPNAFEPAKKRNTLRITWELPGELFEFEKDGKKVMLPHTVSETYTFSMSPKGHLFKMVESWRGKKFSEEEKNRFNVAVLAGVPCNLTVVHNESTKKPGKIYTNVGAVAKLMKGVEKPKQIGETIVFGYGPFDPETFEKLTAYEKKLIQESDEFKATKYTPKQDGAAGSTASQPLDEGNNTGIDEDDDLPF